MLLYFKEEPNYDSTLFPVFLQLTESITDCHLDLFWYSSIFFYTYQDNFQRVKDCFGCIFLCVKKISNLTFFEWLVFWGVWINTNLGLKLKKCSFNVVYEWFLEQLSQNSDNNGCTKRNHKNCYSALAVKSYVSVTNCKSPLSEEQN